MTAEVIVAGATGNVGGAVVEALLGRDVGVRAIVRSARDRVAADAQPVVADLDDPDSVARAAQGAQGAFLLPGFRDMPALVDALKAVGVTKVVQLSGSSAGDGDPTNAISESMRRSERAVQQAGVFWTILRPNAFMSNALRWRAQVASGVVRLPFADVPLAYVDPADIGAVAATALLDPGHEGETYRLSGPEALTPREAVAVLAETLGRPLRFEAVPDDVARAEMLATTPEPYVDAFFRFYVDGTVDETTVHDTVRRVTGWPAGTFAGWAHAHRRTFQTAA